MDIDIQEEGLDQTHHVGNLKVCKEGKPSSELSNLLLMMCVVQSIYI